MAAPNDPLTFSDGPGNTASGEEVNQRFDPLYAYVNEVESRLALLEAGGGGGGGGGGGTFVYSQGSLAGRPVSSVGSPGVPGRKFYATDVGLTFNDFGSGWAVEGLPIGAGMDWYGAGDPCPELMINDGRQVARSTYANLFSKLGTTFGAGNGTTTFNLPNVADAVLVGVSGTIARGATGGAKAVTLTTAMMAAHTHAGVAHSHTVVSHTHSQPAHSHSTSAHSHSGVSHTHSQGSHQHDVGGAQVAAGGSSFNAITLGGSGATSGTGNGGTTASGGSGSTGTASPSTDLSGSGTTGGASPLTDTQTAATASTGGGSTTPTMPPYLGAYKLIRVL